MEKEHSKAVKSVPVSVLEGNKKFVSKIMNRNTSRNCSSRRHFRKSGQIPFQWESQPGKAKPEIAFASSAPLKWEEDEEEDRFVSALPSPPCMRAHLQLSTPVSSKESRFWLWNKLKKSRKLRLHGILNYCSQRRS